MMHIFLNALAANSGSGLTYIYNVVPHLSASSGVRTTVAVQPNLLNDFSQLPNVDVFHPPPMGGAARRFWYEQRELPAVIDRSGADVLVSAGNFAVRNSPVPQILLSGNSLYTSHEFRCDLWRRREYRMLIDNALRSCLAKKSVRWADETIAPSKAFAGELSRWREQEVRFIHHGFDCQTFFANNKPLPALIEHELQKTQGSLRLLFVSHYNYYRNFETLLRALALVKNRLPRISLLLTCKLKTGANPGEYDAGPAGRLVGELGIRDNIIELGAVPYSLLHHLYSACDIYVTPAYAESFAHPLVEAMASGLPIVASDLAVHREVCRDAALYFNTFAAAELANRITEVALDPERRSRLLKAGKARACEFSWSRHVNALLQLAMQLCLCEKSGCAELPNPLSSQNASPSSSIEHVSCGCET